MSWDKVDWSQAPDGAVAWSAYISLSNVRRGIWHLAIFWEGSRDPSDCGWESAISAASDFGYTGHPRDSLTIRPKGEKE